MGYTIAEKILARVSARPGVKAGDAVQAKPDFVVAYDFPGYTDVIFRQMKEEFGIDKVEEPDRFVLFIDHMVPAVTAKEEALHKITRDWAKKQGVALYERKGIGHQVAAELGYAVPGAFVVHFDGHISQLGTFGTLAIGLRRNLLEAFVRETVAVTVPQTVRVNLRGRLAKGVMGRDVLHHIVGAFGPDFCRFKVLEYGGDGLAGIALGERQTLTGLAMFTGAITAIINPMQDVIDYVAPVARKALEPVSSDEDAEYAAVYEVDLSAIEPTIVVPPSNANIRNLVDYVGLETQVGYLGSCASGRIEDLRAAAEILRGRKVKDGFALNVVPTSQALLTQAIKEGLIEVFAEAGAFITSSSCDYCFGRLGVMMEGQRAVSTGTLNVPGRMGAVKSEIYLCNAAVVAATAIEGRIADPRPYIK